MLNSSGGQGAKDIGGEVKIKDLKKAQMLHERGYIVLPDPTDHNVIKAFQMGASRNSRDIHGWEW